MRRRIPIQEKEKVVSLMLYDGLSQRQIDKLNILSRPTIRKIAKEIGYQFPRNGIEVCGDIHMCFNCGVFITKPPSRVIQNNHIHCSTKCKYATSSGEGHHSYMQSKFSRVFPIWVKNQPEYKTWSKAVHKKFNNRCFLSGRFDELECFHIFHMYEDIDPTKAFLIENSLLLSHDVYEEAFQFTRHGFSFEDVSKIIKDKYKE